MREVDFCEAKRRRELTRLTSQPYPFLFHRSEDVSFEFYRLVLAGHILLLRFPKSLIGLERRAILTAAPSSPRFIAHWARFGDDARATKDAKRSWLVPPVRAGENFPFALLLLI